MQYFSVWPSYTSHNWYKRHAGITARWLLDEIYRGPRPQLCNSSSSLFEPKLFLAPPQCCSADTRRQSVENVKMYGILWLLPCHEPLVCLCLCLCCGVVGELLPSRNVVTRAEGGIVWLSLAGDLGGVCPLWLLSSSPTGLSISRQSAQQAAHYYCCYLPSSGQ